MFLGPQWHFWSFVGRLLLPCHRSVDDHRWARGTSWDESRPEKKKKKKLIDSACKFFSSHFHFNLILSYILITPSFYFQFLSLISFHFVKLLYRHSQWIFPLFVSLALPSFPSLPFPSLPFPSLPFPFPSYFYSSHPSFTLFHFEYRTFPLMATGRSLMAWIPRIADCGGLIIGVPIKDPKTPPFEMVNVPPSISSIARSPSRA